MKKRRTFSAEYRRDAVRLVLEQGYSQAEAARSLGIGCTAISRWVHEFNARGDDARLSRARQLTTLGSRAQAFRA